MPHTWYSLDNVLLIKQVSSGLCVFWTYIRRNNNVMSPGKSVWSNISWRKLVLLFQHIHFLFPFPLFLLQRKHSSDRHSRCIPTFWNIVFKISSGEVHEIYQWTRHILMHILATEAPLHSTCIKISSGIIFEIIFIICLNSCHGIKRHVQEPSISKHGIRDPLSYGSHKEKWQMVCAACEMLAFIQ